MNKVRAKIEKNRSAIIQIHTLINAWKEKYGYNIYPTKAYCGLFAFESICGDFLGEKSYRVTVIMALGLLIHLDYSYTIVDGDDEIVLC